MPDSFKALFLLSLLYSNVCFGQEAIQTSDGKSSVRQAEPHPLSDSKIDWQAQLYVERGLRTYEDNPHAGLPWLIAALHEEDDRGLSTQMHRIRINDMIRGLPRLVNFYPGKVNVESSPSGDYLAFIEYKKLSIYHFEKEEITAEIEHSFPITHIAFDPTAKRIVTVCKHEKGLPLGRIWDVDSGSPLTEYVNLGDQKFGMKQAPKIRFSDDDSKLILEDVHMVGRWKVKGRFQLFDAETFEPLGPPIAHQHAFDGGSYHEIPSDGTRILFAAGLPSTDERYTWEGKGDWPDNTPPHQISLLTGEMVHKPLPVVLNYYPDNYFAYSPDGKMIATGTQSQVHLWNAMNGELIHEWKFPEDTGYATVKFHSDGKRILISQNRESKLWDLETYLVIKEWSHGRTFKIGPQFQSAIYSESDNSLLYVDNYSNQETDVFSVPGSWGLEFSPNEKYLLSEPRLDDNSSPYVIRPQTIYKIQTGELLIPPWRFEPLTYDRPFSNNDRYFASQDDYGIWIWDLENEREEVHTLTYNENTEWRCTANSYDKQKIFTVDLDQNLLVWDTNSLEVLAGPYPIPKQTADEQKIQWFRMFSDNSGDNVALLGGIDNPLQEEADDEDEFIPVVQLFNLSKKTPVGNPLIFNEHPISYLQSAVFTSDGKQLALMEVSTEQTGDRFVRDTRESFLHQVDVYTGKITRNLHQFDNKAWIENSHLSGDRCMVVEPLIERFDGTSDLIYNLHLIETVDWIVLSIANPQTTAVIQPLILHPNGKQAISSNGTIWNLENDQFVTRPQSQIHNPLEPTLFHKSKMYATIGTTNISAWGSPREIRIHSLVDGRTLFPPVTTSNSTKLTTALHDNGRILATADNDVKLSDMQHGTPLTPLIELDIKNSYEIGSLFFSPNSEQLIVRCKSKVQWINVGQIIGRTQNDIILQAWSNILSCRKIDSTKGISIVTQEEMIESYQTIRAATQKSD